MRKTKVFDAVKSMRRIRDRLSREIEGMTPAQEIEFFRRKAAERETGAERETRPAGQRPARSTLARKAVSIAGRDRRSRKS